MEGPVRWARAAASGRPRSPDLLNTLGATLYRVGRYAEAAQRLEEAVAIRGRDGDALDRLLLAMAYARLGQPEFARSWLARAFGSIGRPKWPHPPSNPDTLSPDWNDELEVAILRLEAEALILLPDLSAEPFGY